MSVSETSRSVVSWQSVALGVITVGACSSEPQVADKQGAPAPPVTSFYDGRWQHNQRSSVAEGERGIILAALLRTRAELPDIDTRPLDDVIKKMWLDDCDFANVREPIDEAIVRGDLRVLHQLIDVSNGARINWISCSVASVGDDRILWFRSGMWNANSNM